MQTIRIIFCIIIVFFIADTTFTKIYCSQGDDDNYYSEDLTEEDDYEEISEEDDVDDISFQSDSFSVNSGAKDLEAELFNRYNPTGAVEKASIATVTVKTSMGTGSGFFITSNGYIITNKHVLRGDKNQLDKAKKQIDKIDSDTKKYKKLFAAEEKWLEKREKQLEEYKEKIDKLTYIPLKESETEKYKMAYDNYLRRKENFSSQKQEFLSNLDSYSSAKDDYSYKVAVGALSSNFTIIIKDGREFDVYLVAESRDADLALLKIDDIITPFIKPTMSHQTSQGQEVYAIGSPIGLRDSVSSGIISGYENGYIKTNAQIYPGNSGGPLITNDGKVIGINTLKMLTRNYEGLGFAIPIEIAVSEFESYLNNP
ncbi:MAG: trypsin-like peptidase domain-containing protein [Pseudomonadota bacterium]